MAKASEFGGHDGRIQPLPHSLTAAEAARLMRATNPMDPTANVDDQRIADAGKRGIGPVDPAGDL